MVEVTEVSGPTGTEQSEIADTSGHQLTPVGEASNNQADSALATSGGSSSGFPSAYEQGSGDPYLGAQLNTMNNMNMDVGAYSPYGGWVTEAEETGRMSFAGLPEEF